MTDSPFRIDIISSDGITKVDTLANIIQLNDTRVLDKIGQLNFAMPANDPKTRLITSGSQFDVYDEIDGYLGRFLFDRMTTTDDSGRGIITIECWSILKELQYYIAGFAREYQSFPVQNIIDDLVTDVSGWTTESQPNMGLANVTYQGHTIYQGVEELAKRWGYHYRIKSGSERILEFKSLGEIDTSVRLINLDGQSVGIDSVTEIGIIKGVKKTISTDEIFNRVIAVGAGVGAGQLRLKNGQVGDNYTVQQRTRSNGQNETYIEDTLSINQYGVREIVVVFDSIRPIANSTTAKTSSQTELLKNAEIWLGRYKDAREQYDNLVVYGLKTDIKIGDKISVRYKEKDDDGNLYIDIDDTFWVIQHDRTRRATGERSSNLTIVNVDRTEQTDTDVMASAVKAIHSEKLWIKPSAFSQSDTYSDFAANSNSLYADKDAIFNIKVDDTVTDITRFIIEFRTKPIFCTSVWTSSGLTQTLNANPTTPHLHFLDLSTLATNGTFTILESPNYPTDISLELNGVNIDNQASIDYLTGGNGEWNSGGAGYTTSLFVRMDITDYVLGLAGGIYQNFQFKFILNTARTHDTAIPYYTTNVPQNNSTANQGIIEFKALIQGTAQAIYKS